MLFWDTSAVIRLYVDEPDARPFRTLAQRPESLLISAFTVHELHCGLHRKEFVKALKPGMAEVLYQTFRDEIEAEYFRLIAYNSRRTSRNESVPASERLMPTHEHRVKFSSS